MQPLHPAGPRLREPLCGMSNKCCWHGPCQPRPRVPCRQMPVLPVQHGQCHYQHNPCGQMSYCDGDVTPHQHHNHYDRLLQSIANEEAALACLVNQEAMKTKMVAEHIAGQFTPDEVIAFQRSLASVLYNIQKKEELLIKKMRLVFDAQSRACNQED